MSTFYSEKSIGGIERYMQNVINYCYQKDKEVAFLMHTDKEESKETTGNVTVYKKNFLTTKDKKQLSEAELKKKTKEFYLFLKNLLEEEKIDIVDAENFHTDLPAAYSLILNMVCLAKDIPVVLRVHSFATKEIQESLVNSLFWEKVVCVSKSVAGDFFNKGVNINKLDTHYLGVDTKEFKPDVRNCNVLGGLPIPKDSKVILHASRITDGKKDILKEKGITALLDAFSQIASKNEDVTLLLAIAKAPEKFEQEFNNALDKLKGYIQLNNLTNKVVCQEFTLSQMPCVYNSADIFVMASENETFGQVYIEAMACGIPVIGTNVGGIPEVITDNYDGFLVEPNNPSLLMQKIEKLLYDDSTRKEFIRNGLKTVRRKFSTERQFMLLFSRFEKIVASATNK